MISTITPITNKLKESGLKVIYNPSTVQIPLPYISYELDIPFTAFKTQTGELIVEVFSKSITEVETVRLWVWQNLDRWTYHDADVTISSRQLSNSMVRDDDCYRRRLTFQLLMEEKEI